MAFCGTGRSTWRAGQRAGRQTAGVVIAVLKGGNERQDQAFVAAQVMAFAGKRPQGAGRAAAESGNESRQPVENDAGFGGTERLAVKPVESIGGLLSLGRVACDRAVDDTAISADDESLGPPFQIGRRAGHRFVPEKSPPDGWECLAEICVMASSNVGVQGPAPLSMELG